MSQPQPTPALQPAPGPALTCCCPAAIARESALATVQQWQAVWASFVYVTWTGADGHPPVEGGHVCLNWSQTVVQCPSPEPTYLTTWPSVTDPGSLAAVWAWEVLDKHEAPNRWLRKVSTALAPGGLFVATFALWDAEGPDVASGAAERRRIYTVRMWQELGQDLRRLGFAPLGKIDWRYYGHAVGGDHTIGTVVAVRRAS